MMNENGFHLFNIKLVLKAPDYGFPILVFLFRDEHTSQIQVAHYYCVSSQV